MFSLSSERISRNSNWGPLLVWAKMRGYPYWPAVVARDPKNGEYATVTDTFLKPIKKFHVLFLEYGNQRAWVTSSSIKEYKGIDKFNSDKAGATKSQRADYTPGKRYVAPFNKAVDYAEELRGGPVRLGHGRRGGPGAASLTCHDWSSGRRPHPRCYFFCRQEAETKRQCDLPTQHGT